MKCSFGHQTYPGQTCDCGSFALLSYHLHAARILFATIRSNNGLFIEGKENIQRSIRNSSEVWKAKIQVKFPYQMKWICSIHVFSHRESFSFLRATFVRLLLNSNHNDNCILMCGCLHMCKEMEFRWSWKLRQYHYHEASTLMAWHYCMACVYTLNRYGTQSGFCRIPLVHIRSICYFIFISSNEPWKLYPSTLITF